MPPHSIETEQSVLGSMMVDAYAAEIAFEEIGDCDMSVEATPFYRDAHAIIYMSAVAILKRNERVDLLTITDRLREKGNLDLIGGPSYLVELTSRIVTTANVQTHSRIIKQKHLAREMIVLNDMVNTELWDGYENPMALNDVHQAALFDMRSKVKKPEFEGVGVLAERKLASLALMGDLVAPGIKLGIDVIDSVTGGLRPTRYYALGAREGTGKSALAVDWALNAAFGKDKSYGVFHWTGEMSKDDVTTRILANLANVDSMDIDDNKLTVDEREDMNAAAYKLAKTPYVIDDTSGITPLQLRAAIRRAMRQHPIDLVIIDCIQWMEADYIEHDNTKRMTAISKQLKRLAKDLKVSVLVLSSLRRDEKNPYSEPNKSMLRESGQLESDADAVMLLWLKEPYEGEDVVPITVKFDKQRARMMGRVEIAFRRSRSHFTDKQIEFPEFKEPEQQSFF